MDEILKVDANSKPISGAVTDDASANIRMLRIDDATKGLKVSVVGGSLGTVTSITQGAGLLLSPNPLISTGTVALATNIQPIATLGTALQQIRVNAGATALEYFSAGSSGLTIGTTTITSGTTTRILYNNAGVVGEYIISGTGNVAMTNSPVFTTPNIGVATGSVSGNAGTVTTNANLTGVVTSVGNATAIADNALTIAKTSGLQTALDAKALLAGSVSQSFGASTLELGHATDTTIARSSAGQVTVEGAPVVIEGYTTIATAAGTTTLTVASTRQQFFTVSPTKTVTLPVTST